MLSLLFLLLFFSVDNISQSIVHYITQLSKHSVIYESMESLCSHLSCIHTIYFQQLATDIQKIRIDFCKGTAKNYEITIVIFLHVLKNVTVLPRVDVFC